MVYGQFPSSIPFIRLDLHSLLVQPKPQNQRREQEKRPPVETLQQIASIKSLEGTANKMKFKSAANRPGHARAAGRRQQDNQKKKEKIEKKAQPVSRKTE